MKPRITVITLGVDDLQRALEFYRNGLGLKSEGIVGTEFEHGAVAFFDLQAGLKLALWPRKSLAHDTGLAVSAPSPSDFFPRAQCDIASRSGRGDGASVGSRRNDRQSRARYVLRRLRRLLPGPGPPSVGSILEFADVACGLSAQQL